MRLFLIFSVFMGASALAGVWAVYYEREAPVQSFKDFDFVVLDSDFHPPLRPLLEQGKLLFGYLSLCEVRRDQRHFEGLKSKGVLVGENPFWEGNHYIDIRDPDWAVHVIEELIPAILQKGFGGLFLDTLDDAPHLERTDPGRFKGMTQAAADLVRAIRRHYPSTKIMLNRAYEILPQVEDEIDFLLGESVYSDYDFEKKSYGRVEEGLYRRQVRILQEAKNRRPELRVFTLDYWAAEDSDGIAAIYRTQRANGFEPYVATILLDQLIAEPGLP